MDSIDWNDLWWQDNGRKVLWAIIGSACLLLGIVGLVIRSAVRSANKGKARSITFAAREPTPNPDAPGRFEITGVDRETRMDTIWRCDAQSPDNARAKGKLEGIVVTGVRRIPK